MFYATPFIEVFVVSKEAELISCVTTFGAVLGLVLAIALIVHKIKPAYGLICGALLGGIIGGASLADTVSAMIAGAQGMMSSVLRILTSGILAGALIKSGSAERIAAAIVGKLGQRHAVVAIALATMLICAVGVFIDIAVITVAPIALAVGQRAGLSKSGILLAMIGGGKAGNIISPNPNTIAVSEAFKVVLTALMAQNILPALGALVLTVCLARRLARRSDGLAYGDPSDTVKTPVLSLWRALAGPATVVALLSLRPLVHLAFDPLVALPIGGLICIIVCGHWRRTAEFTEYGLSKVVDVSVLLVATGTLAGIIKESALQGDMIALLQWFNLPTFALAPLSGLFMAAATASTTAGATIASQTFAAPLMQAGVPALAAGATIHAGATIADSLPHGSFFHATGGAVYMDIGPRLRLIPYEMLIGLASTVLSALLYVWG